MKTINIPSIDRIADAAREFVDAMGPHTVFAFDAPMGAGKTTFINALCRELGVENEATGSPTFAIVNEYARPTGKPIYHFDTYRIESLEEALDFGIEDYFDSGCICLVEWPDRVAPLLPDDAVYVTIDVNPDLSRTITLHYE